MRPDEVRWVHASFRLELSVPLVAAYPHYVHYFRPQKNANTGSSRKSVYEQTKKCVLSVHFSRGHFEASSDFASFSSRLARAGVRVVPKSLQLSVAMVLPCRLLAHYLALDFCCEHVKTLGFERRPQNNALGPRTRCLSKRHFWGCVRIWLII